MTTKQSVARSRNWFKFRLVGLIGMFGDNNYNFTNEESKKIKKIQILINELIESYNDNHKLKMKQITNDQGVRRVN